jgi:hypothetical protein
MLTIRHWTARADFLHWYLVLVTAVAIILALARVVAG